MPFTQSALGTLPVPPTTLRRAALPVPKRATLDTPPAAAGKPPARRGAGSPEEEPLRLKEGGRRAGQRHPPADTAAGPGPGRVSPPPRGGLPQAGDAVPPPQPRRRRPARPPPPTHADAGGPAAVLGAAIAVKAAALVAGQQRGAALAALPGAHQAAGAAVQHGGHSRGAARRLSRAAPAAGPGTRRFPAAHLRGQSGPEGQVTGPARPPAPSTRRLRRAPRTCLAQPEEEEEQQGGQALPAALRHGPGLCLPAAPLGSAGRAIAAAYIEAVGDPPPPPHPPRRGQRGPEAGSWSRALRSPGSSRHLPWRRRAAAPAPPGPHDPAQPGSGRHRREPSPRRRYMERGLEPRGQSRPLPGRRAGRAPEARGSPGGGCHLQPRPTAPLTRPVCLQASPAQAMLPVINCREIRWCVSAVEVCGMANMVGQRLAFKTGQREAPPGAVLLLAHA